ncbi:Indole-3-glycerol phosphate synthase [bioreactor metagenome]|uniref:indole-3-glycerol-phosphate synthase n=1 Tax=bioreactor metagenome TaxID=1076179 RepID=A0A645CRF4_9ZZZZ
MNKPDILTEIAAVTRRDLEKQKRLLPPETLASLCAAHHRAIRDFCGALKRPDRRSGTPKVIAELKKASPSSGVIRADFRPLELAPALEQAGAGALSVLTEPHYFQGAPATLSGVAKLVKIPLLRKDFIIDAYQIGQAWLWGADAVLLIAALLDQNELRALSRVAADHGLAVLGEAHTEAELERLLAVDEIRAVGVNCRDLRTFRTDWDGAARLLDLIPADKTAVAESGIAAAADLRRLPADAFLIGTTLMKADDPAAKLKELLS